MRFSDDAVRFLLQKRYYSSNFQLFIYSYITYFLLIVLGSLLVINLISSHSCIIMQLCKLKVFVKWHKKNSIQQSGSRILFSFTMNLELVCWYLCYLLSSFLIQIFLMQAVLLDHLGKQMRMTSEEASLVLSSLLYGHSISSVNCIQLVCCFPLLCDAVSYTCGKKYYT